MAKTVLNLCYVNSKVVSFVKKREKMCSILIAQKSDLIVRFSVCVEISLRLWNKVNYLRNSHYIPPPPSYRAEDEWHQRKLKIPAVLSSHESPRLTRYDGGGSGHCPSTWNIISESIFNNSNFFTLTFLWISNRAQSSLEFLYNAGIYKRIIKCVYIYTLLIFVLCRCWGVAYGFRFNRV
jgi:hypothetical protein